MMKQTKQVERPCCCKGQKSEYMEKSSHPHDTNKSLQKGGGNNFVFYYKKAEKVVSALYLITNHFDQNEPLKWRIRQQATEMLRCISALKDTTGVLQEERKQHIQQIADDISSCVSVAKTAGLVSPSNAQVCSHEIGALSDGVCACSEFSGPRNMILSHEFFRTEAEPENGLSAQAERTPPAEPSPAHEPPPEPAAAADTTPTPAQKTQEPKAEHTPAHSPKPAVQAKKNQRQRSILKLVRDRGEISVRDAAEVISNCSEKTLQRELSALVKEGVLQKRGERRWTRYSFA